MSEKAITTNSYKKLVKTINKEIQDAGARLKASIETEKVLLYWRMGKHIQIHLLEHKERAEYGKELFPQLASEINVSESLLRRIVKFYNTFPIQAARPELTWTHYKILLPVADKEKRDKYIEKIKQESLSVRELRLLIAEEENKQDSINDSEKNAYKLSVIRGVPFVYKIKRIDCLKPNNSRIVVDCGFNIFTGVHISNLVDFIPNQTVQVKKTNSHYILQKTDISLKQIYTYKAHVEKVLDGDTLWAVLDLGFNIYIRQKIRLHKIDAPPVETEQGTKTKHYLYNKLKPLDFIVVKTHWRDKFDRYLADVFYLPKEEDFLEVTRKGKYLNQKLVDRGFCEVVAS